MSLATLDTKEISSPAAVEAFQTAKTMDQDQCYSFMREYLLESQLMIPFTKSALRSVGKQRQVQRLLPPQLWA